MVRVNGAETSADGMTIEGYLSGTKYDKGRIAVECNGEIVPKAAYGETILKDGDVLEVVSFVGGG